MNSSLSPASDPTGRAPRFSNVGVVIPVYNEHRLSTMLAKFQPGHLSEIVVVDDGSDDGSTEAAASAPFTLLTLDRRSGVGAAIRAGLLHLRSRGCSVAVVMAGNGKDDPADIPALLAAIQGGADYVQGSRYLDSRRGAGTPPVRRAITRAVAALWSLRFLRPLTDVTNGFRAYRLSLLDDPRIDVRQAWLNRYELEYYLHYKVLALRFRYAEVPVWKNYPQDGRPTTKIRLARDAWSLLRPLVLLTVGLRK